MSTNIAEQGEHRICHPGIDRRARRYLSVTIDLGH